MITKKWENFNVLKIIKFYANKINYKKHNLLHYANNPLFKKVAEKVFSEK